MDTVSTLTLEEHIRKQALAFFVSGLKSYAQVEAFYEALENGSDLPLEIWEPFEKMSMDDLINNMENLESDFKQIARLAQKELLEQMITIKNILEQGEKNKALQAIYQFLEINDKLMG